MFNNNKKSTIPKPQKIDPTSEEVEGDNHKNNKKIGDSKN